MTEFVWSEVRADWEGRFGALGSNLEAEILPAFRAKPVALLEAIDRVGRRFETGQVRSPWVIVAREAGALLAARSEDVRVEAGRERRVSQAKQWVRASGLHFDRWAEVEDELFGDLGRLRSFASDEGLRAELETLWESLRPAGVRVVEQELERAERWKQQRRRSREAPEPGPLPLAELLRGLQSQNGNGAGLS